MDVISVSSVVIAVCALGATIYQAHLSQQHNRLSVKPVLIMTDRRETQGLGSEFHFSIDNCGIGPAMVVDRYFLVDGVRFEASGRSGDTVAELMNHVFQKRYAYELLEHGFPGPKAVFAVDESFTLARIRFPTANGLILDAVSQELDRIVLVVDYESMYRERFQLKTV